MAVRLREQTDVDAQRDGRPVLLGLHPHWYSKDLGFSLHGESDGGLDEPAGLELRDAHRCAQLALQDGDA